MAAGLVVIGTSLGGLKALEVLLAGLLPDFALPVAVVQHRGLSSDDSLVALLRSFGPLPVEEPEDKQPIVAGRVYLAPSGYHLLVDDAHFALALEAPVLHARPAIDVLFESAARSYGERLIGVILTGASKDGAAGARALKDRGGLLIVQEPDSAESSTMPAAAIAAAPADHVVKLAEIAPLLNRCAVQKDASPRAQPEPAADAGDPRD